MTNGPVSGISMNVVIAESAFTNNTVRGPGGAVCIMGGKVLILGSTFTANTATGMGGLGSAISMYGGALALRDTQLVKNNCAGCGTVLDLSDDGSATLTNVTFADNLPLTIGYAIERDYAKHDGGPHCWKGGHYTQLIVNKPNCVGKCRDGHCTPASNCAAGAPPYTSW